MHIIKNGIFNMDDSLRTALEALPESSESICQIYSTDDEFRLLCQDYVDTLNAIKTWRQSEKNEAPMRVKEYQSLAGELRRDMKIWIEKVMAHKSPY